VHAAEDPGKAAVDHHHGQGAAELRVVLCLMKDCPMSDARLSHANAKHAISYHRRGLMNAMKHSGCWGVPLPRLKAGARVALSAASPRADYRAVGFPLQSLTRSTHKPAARDA
jgi:hypothetical protein